MYSHEEALEQSRKYFGGNELAADAFVNKYALRDEEDNLVESNPDQMHRREAKEFARVEKQKFINPLSEDFIYDCLKDFRYIIPQGSPAYGIGNKYKYISLSNCFVVQSPSDSYGGICRTDEEIAQISKRRGGIGYDISELRPEGMTVTNSARTTTGAVSFMHRFSNTGREVGQNGRRGAQMVSISVHHPDILKFATVKNDDVSVTGANISVRLSNEFLEAVRNGTKYEQRWPVESKTPKVSRLVDAREVWKVIIHSAWLRAEPGLLFWDNIISESPADCYASIGFKTVSTNPCGEIPLCAYDSCRLLVLNLLSFVENPFTKQAKFNYKKFYQYAQIAQRLMDDLVDLEIEAVNRIINKIENDPEPTEVKQTELSLWTKIAEMAELGRRTGLGITALGDTIAALGIKYGSKKSLETAEQIYQTLKFGSYRASVDMAKELGSFPVWDWEMEKNCPFLNRMKDEVVDLGDESVLGISLFKEMETYGRRNIANLTTAPTGTSSLVALVHASENLRLFATSSGIEPTFMVSYTRRRKVRPDVEKGIRIDFTDDLGDYWQEYTVYHEAAKLWMQITGETDITKSPWHGACAEEIDWSERVKLQAACNHHIDHSISSTINLPEDVTEEQVAKIYETAWKAGCKGITVYRKNCRSGVLIEKKKSIPKTDAPKRPKELPCDIFVTSYKGKEYFLLVGLYDGQPYELFAGENSVELTRKYKQGRIVKNARGKYVLYAGSLELISDITANITDDEEAITRLVSTSLRHGCDTAFVVHQLEKVKGHLFSFAKVISRTLKKFIKDGTALKGEVCPECSGELIRTEGCVSCRSCVFSKC